ncbi:MAG: CsgG/HfaB family protein [Bryobacteraceae bacterium]|jgi:curli biogenesis system outer membrane secretion channel CsgG
MRLRLGGLVLVLALTGGAQTQAKKRVAVMNFDYATVMSSIRQLFGSDQDVGKGIADLLVDRLVNDGAYAVIERKELDKVLAEQNFSNSDRADPTTAAKIARVLGVNVIIIGSITQFGRDDKKTDVGGGALGGVTGRFGVGGLRKSQATAVVQITGRMIDTTTAEILASCTAKGSSSRSGTGILGAGGGGGSEGGGGMDMKSSNFGATILGEATTKAVTDLATQLDARATQLPVETVSIDGMVADASDDGTLILNVGSRSGLKVGDTLQVKHPGREIRDPATGKVLRRIEESVGTVTVTEIEETSAVGKFSGTGKPQVKDTVSNK